MIIEGIEYCLDTFFSQVDAISCEQLTVHNVILVSLECSAAQVGESLGRSVSDHSIIYTIDVLDIVQAVYLWKCHGIGNHPCE